MKKRTKKTATSACGRPCSVCKRPKSEVEAINEELAAGRSVRDIVASHPPLSASALARHKEHLPAAAGVTRATPGAPPEEPGPVPTASSMAEQLGRFCQARLVALETNAGLSELDRGRAAERLSLALTRLGQLTGETLDLPESKLVRMPRLKAIFATVIDALTPWPQALAAMADAVKRLETGSSTPAPSPSGVEAT